MALLRKFISYFFDLTQEKVQSRYSGEVVVAYSRGQYKLSTSKAIYSFGKYYTSFDTVFRQLQVGERPVQSVLVLGFGLGSVVDLLGQHPSIQLITAVDADDVIMDLGKKYLQSGLKSKVEWVCADAAAFASTTTQTYDLVLFDVFIDDLTPVVFMQTEFLESLKKTVAPGGLLLFSKIHDSHHSKIENEQFEKRFTKVFPSAFSIDTDGNKLFCWENKQ